MIDAGLCRGVINARVSRIKRMFRWASKKRLVPAETYYGLMAVEGLLRGRSKARETAPVTTVPEADVVAVFPHVLPEVRDDPGAGAGGHASPGHQEHADRRHRHDRRRVGVQTVDAQDGTFGGSLD